MDLLLFLIVLLIIYFLPWIIALSRGHQAALAIFVCNLFVGWTFIGWVVSLVWSCMPVQRTAASS